VHVIQHTLIPLKGGTMLAARIWLPEDAEQNPVPAVLEFLPYRKGDALTHPYLAGYG
jgi:predicted acyl esterase